MRADMGGAAITVATIYAMALNRTPGKMVALTPLAENLPSGSANKPGDVVVARNGMTIQVLLNIPCMRELEGVPEGRYIAKLRHDTNLILLHQNFS